MESVEVMGWDGMDSVLYCTVSVVCIVRAVWLDAGDQRGLLGAPGRRARAARSQVRPAPHQQRRPHGASRALQVQSKLWLATDALVET